MIKMWLNLVISSILLFGSTITFADSSSPTRALSPNVSVVGDMTPAKFKNLMQQDFKSVIVNRPDQEVGNQTTASELRSLAEKANKSLIYQPVVSGQITDSDAQEFAKYYNSLPKPILLVCKSGSRSTVLFNKAKSLGLIDE
jgi:uncharacterized protein (TIGR01244 family)